MAGEAAIHLTAVDHLREKGITDKLRDYYSSQLMYICLCWKGKLWMERKALGCTQVQMGGQHSKQVGGGYFSVVTKWKTPEQTSVPETNKTARPLSPEEGNGRIRLECWKELSRDCRRRYLMQLMDGVNSVKGKLRPWGKHNVLLIIWGYTDTNFQRRATGLARGSVCDGHTLQSRHGTHLPSVPCRISHTYETGAKPAGCRRPTGLLPAPTHHPGSGASQPGRGGSGEAPQLVAGGSEAGAEPRARRQTPLPSSAPQRPPAPGRCRLPAAPQPTPSPRRAAAAYRQHGEQRGLARVLQPHQGQLHLLLPEERPEPVQQLVKEGQHGAGPYRAEPNRAGPG